MTISTTALFRRLGSPLVRWSRPALAALVLLVAACADHIVSVDGATRSQRVTAGVGDLVDIPLWAGALGTYADAPTVSGSAVEFVHVTIDSPPNPGGPTQRFRFRALSRGTALVTFTPLQSAPVIVDTIVVR